DVMPTVLEAIGAPVPPDVQGEALVRVSHEIVAEEHINPEFVSHYGEVYNRAIRVIYDGPYKLITTSKGERMLFDLAHDPGEAHDLTADEPGRGAERERRLEATMSTMVSRAEASRPVN